MRSLLLVTALLAPLWVTSVPANAAERGEEATIWALDNLDCRSGPSDSGLSSEEDQQPTGGRIPVDTTVKAVLTPVGVWQTVSPIAGKPCWLSGPAAENIAELSGDVDAFDLDPDTWSDQLWVVSSSDLFDDLGPDGNFEAGRVEAGDLVDVSTWKAIRPFDESAYRAVRIRESVGGERDGTIGYLDVDATELSTDRPPMTASTDDPAAGEGDASDQAGDNQEEASDSGGAPWAWLVGAVAVVAAVIGGIAFGRRKSKEGADGESENSPEA